MYGIEYSTLANLIKDDDDDTKEDENYGKSNTNTNSKNNKSFNQNISNDLKANQTKSFQTNSGLSENLLYKLHNLKKCPAYLLPKTDFLPTPSPSTTTHNNNNTAHSSSFSTNQSTNKQVKNYYTDDFILLSEFSEIEGPKPLLTIPTDGGTGFNKNEYSLHLMCVDFHSHVQNRQQPQPTVQESEDSEMPIKRQNKFNLTEDTSIINYWDPANSVAACVHHFNLYDLEARGFVRPFCIAYISYDRIKPVVYFDSIRRRFNEITDLLKKSNFNLFKLDLEQRCLDLNFTRNLFLKWSAETPDPAELKQTRAQLAKENKLDMRTCGRLTASSANEKTKQLQLNAIDTLVKELEGVIEVIRTELKAKNWLKLKTKKSTQPRHVRQDLNVSADCLSLPLNKTNEMTLVNKANRSMTFPNSTSDSTSVPVIQVICSQNKRLVLRSPKLFSNILIGNLNTLSSTNNIDLEGFCSGIDYQQLNQSSKRQQHKTMKRLHQLSCHTAKQAINEMRLMQLYFSTPFYLLKFRELATPAGNFSKSNFWSLVCGEIAVANLAVHVDSFNLHKHNLIKWTNGMTQNENFSLFINKLNESFNEEEEDDETLLFSSMKQEESVKTQFYTPLNMNNWLNNQSSETNDSDIEVLSKITPQLSNDQTKSDDHFTTARETAWETAIEQFLELNDSDPKRDDDYEDYEEFHDNYDDAEEEDTLSIMNDSNLRQKKSQDEESEYDFVNALLTAEYKPYNQYSTNLDALYKNTTDLRLGASSLSLSSSFTSPAIVYSAFNRCKYQANLTDKLIQIIEFNFEETLKQLLNTFNSIMPHLFYSLLKGRPVICVSRYCDSLPYLTAVIDCLSNFVPNSFDSLSDLVASNGKPKFTSSPMNGLDATAQTANTLSPDEKSKLPQLKAIYERRPIKLNDLKYCKLFGLSLMISKDDSCCSQDCNSNLNSKQTENLDTLNADDTIIKKRSSSFYKHQHKHYHQSKSNDDESVLLKYIPITIQNYVSIFDLDRGTFTGPKYTGLHLKNCLHKAKQMQQDSIIYLYLLNHLVKYYVKIAFLYNYSILFEYQANSVAAAAANLDGSSKMYTRRNSLQTSEKTFGHDFLTKRERIKRYFSLYNNSFLSSESNNDLNKSNKSYYSSFSSLGTLAYGLIGYDSQKQQQMHRSLKSRQNSLTSFSDDDFELLKVILALVDLNMTNSKHNLNSNTNSSSNSGTSSPGQLNLNSNFDQTDFNIVNYFLRSLQMKQLYLYDLAIRKKKLKETSQINKATKLVNTVAETSQASFSTTSNLLNENNEIQFSLLVDYEELTVFNSKK